MYIIFTILAIMLLILVYPIRIAIYSDLGIKVRMQFFGLINVQLNIKKMVKGLVSRDKTKISEEDDFNVVEILENLKKIRSTRSFFGDLLKRSTVEEFEWYSAIPMNNEPVGLALLPVYTALQTFIIDFLYDNFKQVKDYDIDTKYNYLTDDVFIYLNSIIRINLLKIMIVNIKFIRKLPLLVKRTT